MDEPAWDLPLIEVDLCGMEPEATNTTPVPPLFLAIEPLHHITVAFNLHLQGALEQLQWTSPTTSAPISQHSMPGRKPPSVTLGAPLSTRAADPLSLEGTDLAIPDLMATSSQASPHAFIPENIPSIIQVSHSPSPPTMQKTQEVASISPTPQSQASPRAIPADPAHEVLWLQGEMNAASDWLPMTKATMDSCWRELALNANIAMCQNEAQATEAIKEAEMHWKEAEVHCAAMIKEGEPHSAIHACTLEKSHKENMLELEHEVIAEEGQDCWAFEEACGAVLWACPPEAHGVLMYPLQLLTGNVLLAAILGMPATTLQLTTAGRELVSTASQLKCQRSQHSQLETNGSMAHLTRNNHAETRGKGSCGARHHSPRVAMPKAERGEALGKTPQGEPLGSLWEWLWTCLSN